MHDACGSHHRWLLGGLVVRERPGVHQRDCAAQAAGRTGYGLSVRHYGAGGPRPVGRCAQFVGSLGLEGCKFFGHDGLLVCFFGMLKVLVGEYRKK